MKAIKVIGLLGAGYVLAIFVNQVAQKQRALALAISLNATKGIVNLGAGCSRTGGSQAVCELPEVVYNVDLGGNCPKCVIVNLEKSPLPFSNKQFDVAFASHVLEHLVNWEQALNEWTRIADHVVIVLPNPLFILAWVAPEHKQHFSFGDMDYMRNHWANITVFT